MNRRKTKQINVGPVLIGGGAPISIQSMTKTPTANVAATTRQINKLQRAGCDIVRIAVQNEKEACCLADIKKRVKLPIIADIHFHYKLALMAVDAGVDGVRLNPGNIYKKKEVSQVVKACKERDIAIRVGANSGSIVRPEDSQRHPVPELMVSKVLDYIKMIEDMGFTKLKVSLKASNVIDTVAAYHIMSKKTNYPLHLGVTAAGPLTAGIIKSTAGIAPCLLDGIGDTIRVSLTQDPVDEVYVGKQILAAVGLRKQGIDLVSCPTCGRTEIDLAKIVKQVSGKLRHIEKPITVAIMGCVVNGPGEAREADIGIAWGKGMGLLFKQGKPIAKLKPHQLVDRLVEEIETMGV